MEAELSSAGILRKGVLVQNWRSSQRAEVGCRDAGMQELTEAARADQVAAG